MNLSILKNRVRLFRSHSSFTKPPKNRVAEQIVTTLKEDEIFVFGSNLMGAHGGGAAFFAQKHFGAKTGVAVGHTGDCYALPTLSKTYEKLELEYIQSQVNDLIKHAFIRPRKTYVVTEIGCGIAGFSPEDIAPMFKNAIGVENIKLPERFWTILLNK